MSFVRVWPCAVAALSLAALPQSNPNSFHDLIPDLAARIAAAIAPLDRVQLVARDAEASPPAERQSIGRDLARALAARGVTLVDRSDGAAVITYTCSENIRSRICAADIQKENTHVGVVAERGHESHSGAAAPPLVLSIQPVFAQRTRILDLALIGSRLLVLDPTAVSVYERSGDGWRQTKSHPIAAVRPWPRDVRGRLRIDGGALEAFLPGMTCRGPFDAAQGLTCTADQRSWPIGLDNTGIAAGRNVFTSAGGPSFFSAAALGPDAGARWMIATEDNRFLFLDDSRRPIETVANADRWGDDVTAVATPCASGTHVLVTAPKPHASPETVPIVREPQGRLERSSDATDSLHVLGVIGRQLTPVAPPVILPGFVTALWPTNDASRAVVVSMNAVTGVYEAFHAGVSCGR